MKFIDQTKFYNIDGWGNCVSACICSILGWNLSDIKYDIQRDIMRFNPDRYHYLKSRGIDLSTDDNIANIPESIQYIGAIGISPRKDKDGGELHHMVIVDRKGQLVHDPHPDRTGVLRVLYYEYYMQEEKCLA